MNEYEHLPEQLEGKTLFNFLTCTRSVDNLKIVATWCEHFEEKGVPFILTQLPTKMVLWKELLVGGGEGPEDEPFKKGQMQIREV